MRFSLSLVFAMLVSVVFAQTPDSLSISHLSCEGMIEPMMVDVAAPRFSWRLESNKRGARQTAFQLRVTELTATGLPAQNGLIEMSRTENDASQWVEVPALRLHPKQRYQWQVRVWDERQRDSGWSEPSYFETGLLRQPWPATWIGSGITAAREAAPPARYMRKDFEISAAPKKARLYLSAFGLVEPWLNGRKVAADYFLPGWPDYRKRVFYVAYDVTDQVRVGTNRVGLILADGWFSSTLMRGSQFGSQPLASAFLEVTDVAGKTTTVTTSEDWEFAEGPIIAQGIYFGETFDARRDDPAWAQPGGQPPGWIWHAVQVQGIPAVAVNARLSPPVRAVEELRPVSKRKLRPGVFLYDLGQNMVGWVRLKVQASAGQKIQVRMAEMLEADDKLHTANLRRANATATYIARGNSVETWEPRFTFFGFRYVEINGVDELGEDAVTGVVLHSDLPRIGSFECSNPLLNQLYSNTLWGQKGNFLEVPTDCPQRDERLGWTGDAQVFSPTANYNFASGNFYRQWLAAMRDGYRDEPNGVSGFSDVAPDIGLRYGSAGWGDAAVIIPYVTWLHTGDRSLLKENFEAIQQWVEAEARDWPDGLRRSQASYGDWLAPGSPTREGPTPYLLVATAYYAHITELAARIAAELGRTTAAERDRTLLAQIKSAFAREFITEDGHLASDEQTAYLLALGFDLVPESLRDKSTAQLLRTFSEKNNHLATGFLGTPLIAPVLSSIGHADLAYTVLLQETYPGWLFSVKNGATTIWERWDSWTPEAGFHPSGMNSFNHYAYGCVVGWFYDTIAGLAPDPSGPGWKKFRVAPTPGGGLTHAKASVETPYGAASSAWRKTEKGYEFDLTVPVNTQAEVSLPAETPEAIKERGQPLGEFLNGARPLRAAGRVLFVVPAGIYRFTVAAAP